MLIILKRNNIYVKNLVIIRGYVRKKSYLRTLLTYISPMYQQYLHFFSSIFIQMVMFFSEDIKPIIEYRDEQENIAESQLNTSSLYIDDAGIHQSK
jgi:NAD(P)H-dependent FMN reductase